MTLLTTSFPGILRQVSFANVSRSGVRLVRPCLARQSPGVPSARILSAKPPSATRYTATAETIVWSGCTKTVPTPGDRARGEGGGEWWTPVDVDVSNRWYRGIEGKLTPESAKARMGTGAGGDAVAPARSIHTLDLTPT